MITQHAIQRTSERTGLNLVASARFIRNGIERGKGINSFGSNERSFLLKEEAKEGRRAIVYNGFYLLFSKDNHCVTVIRLPVWFGKKQFDGKREIRNARRYIKHYETNEQEDI